MNRTLRSLKVKSMNLYLSYRSGVYTLEEYQEHIKTLDDEIDKLELYALNSHLQGTPASERSSLIPLD